ncbi:MAG: hypothetical protein MHM6MM_006650 [Cercozoa sp. M6MM]
MASSLQPHEEEQMQLFIDFCEKHPDGVSDEAVSSQLPQIGENTRAKIVNELLQTNRLVLQQSRDRRQVYYRLYSEDKARKLVDLNAEAVMIYQMIERGGNMGLWMRDIRKRSNLPRKTAQKHIKKLESRNLIKLVKGAAVRGKDVYMLSELEPARELTGGTFFVGAEFDAQFVRELTAAAYTCVVKQGPVTCAQVHTWLTSIKISKVELLPEDVEQLLYVLEMDGLVERLPPPQFRARELLDLPKPNVEDASIPRYRQARSKPSTVLAVPCVQWYV